MTDVLNSINDFLWAYVVIALLVGCALYFTIRTRGVQFRMPGEMIRIMLGRDTGKSDRNKIGSFKAFSVALASRVGTGNLAGVASAIFVGGPGAVFWMWVMALLGSATAFVEATLAQLYKRRGRDSFYGGPAYYMQHGLHSRWMGVIFAVLITITFGVANQFVQSTTIAEALSGTLGVSKPVIGLVLAFSVLLTIWGGISRISRFSSFIVPIMAVGYLLLTVVVLGINARVIPSVFRLIFDSAFGLRQAAGGAVGMAIMQGVRRGLFSNEAGEGSAPNAAAIADTTHPVKQGLLQALGVFVDTIIICSCTALMILVSGVDIKGADGITLTTNAIEAVIGPVGRIFVTIAVILFAYSTVVGNYFYGETNIRFISSNPLYVKIFKLLTSVIVFGGSVMALQTAWSIVDISMGLMTIVNLIAIVLLSGKVWKLLADYSAQKRAGRDPLFTRDSMPEIADDLDGWS